MELQEENEFIIELKCRKCQRLKYTPLEFTDAGAWGIVEKEYQLLKARQIRCPYCNQDTVQDVVSYKTEKEFEEYKKNKAMKKEDLKNKYL